MNHLWSIFQESARAIEHILSEFKGPSGLDIDGISLFKSPEAVDAHWTTASKHLSCKQVYFLKEFIYITVRPA